MRQAILSIIIPVLNEAAIIQPILWRILQDSTGVEIIVVDGGSHDNTFKLAIATGVKVIVSPKMGRANQMNAGAKIATGDILLFLHADTKLPLNYLTYIKDALEQPQTIAGAFELAIDSPKKSLRLVEAMVKLRSRWFSLPYGDQALFLKKSLFEEIGGFADLPIMEDFELVQRLKRRGKIAIAPAAVLTSSRRWEKLGVFKTTTINQIIILGYYLGISPRRLRRLYQSKTINNH